MDLISVIVPVYRVEEYLDRCVQSLLDQSYENLEIILVDDGSPDNCPVMCDSWAEKDSRIRVIHKVNGGLSDARNVGLDIANGKWIAFVDSDDWVAPDYLSAMYDAVAETGAVLAACDLQMVYDETEAAVSEAPGALRVCTTEEALTDIICGEGFRAVAWNKLYHRTLLAGERYPVGKHHEDEFFTYRILGKAQKLVFVQKALYFYLQRPGSIMGATSVKRLDCLDAYLERLAYLADRFPRLYLRDKISFCMSCVAFYCQFQDCSNSDSVQGRKKIRACRSRVRFTHRELARCGLKQLVYIFCSRYAIGIFSKIRNLKERGAAHV